MDTLEDILTSFGASAEFWATASTADRHAERDEAWDEVKSLILSLPDRTEAGALLIRIHDESNLGNKPTYLSLADIYAERGDAEAAAKAYEKAAEAASKAQEALLREYPDPQDLCWLGYLLLQRCDVDELPLCADHFNFSTMDFSNNDTLVVSHFPFSDAAVQDFSNEPETLRLATRAFGLAWLYYYEHSEKKSDAWQALPALDGLRAALFHADNLEALQVVIDTFWDWVEDWGFGTGLCCDEFVANFRASDAYLQGRLRRDPANRVAAARQLAAQLGETWRLLPANAREYLISAEIHFEHLDKKGDWSPVVNECSKAVESLLKDRIGRYLDDNPQRPLAMLLRAAINGTRRKEKEVKRFSRLSLSTFTDALEKLAPQLADKRLRRLASDLVKLVPLRTKATHADEAWKVFYEHGETVMDLCLGVQPPGLVRLLAQLKLN